MVVWLLIVYLNGYGASYTSVTVPNLISEKECWRVSEAMHREAVKQMSGDSWHSSCIPVAIAK